MLGGECLNCSNNFAFGMFVMAVIAVVAAFALRKMRP